MILCPPKYADIIAAYPLMFQKMIKDYERTCEEFLSDIPVIYYACKDSILFYFPKKSGINGVHFLLDQINSRWYFDAANHEFDVLKIAQPDDVVLQFEGLLELKFCSRTSYNLF